MLRKIPIHLIVSVAAGIATAMALSALTHEILHLLGVFPAIGEPNFDTRLTLIAFFYHSIYAIIGAFVTAIIAKEKAKKAVFILGTKEAIMWLLGIILLWHQAPAWYNLSKAFAGIPLAMVGGKLYELYKLSKQEKTKTVVR
ncbi:MAG: hypothetical protein H0W73_11245 [Bacteroidetes bacterium]|nr:hypothetical protein [Bacteroidota bacterium]